MRYCVNPDCSNPQNSDNADICHSCRSGLLLNERFYPIAFIAKGGFGRVFKAEDKHSISNPVCLIKQFSPGTDPFSDNRSTGPINRSRDTARQYTITNSNSNAPLQIELSQLAK